MKFVATCALLSLLLVHKSFSHQRLLMVLHWSLSDSKSPQVSRTLLGILTVLNNDVVLMVSSRPPTFKFSSPFNNLFLTVPKEHITIGTIVTFKFHSFFISLARSMYLFYFSHSFSFILRSAGTAKSTILQILFFFFVDYYKAGISWSVCMLMPHRSLCVIIVIIIIIIIIIAIWFFQTFMPVVIRSLHWRPNNSKSLPLFRTHLNIRVVLSNSVVWTVLFFSLNLQFLQSIFLDSYLPFNMFYLWLVRFSTSCSVSHLSQDTVIQFQREDKHFSEIY